MIITNNTSLWSFKVKMQKTVKNEVSNIHCVFALTEHVLLIVYIHYFPRKLKYTFAYICSHMSERFFTNINNITDLKLNVTYVEKRKDWTWRYTQHHYTYFVCANYA